MEFITKERLMNVTTLPDEGPWALSMFRGWLIAASKESGLWCLKDGGGWERVRQVDAK